MRGCGDAIAWRSQSGKVPSVGRFAELVCEGRNVYAVPSVCEQLNPVTVAAAATRQIAGMQRIERTCAQDRMPQRGVRQDTASVPG
jgi:hypothetical protein